MPVGFLNRLLFFPPKEDTYSVSSWPGELCMLRGVVCRALPCLRKNEDGELAQKEAPFVLIFCHGNSADLGLCNYLEELRDGLQVHVIGVEYPGFGLSKAGSGFACESTVDDVVRTVYKCLMEDLQWEARRILLMGRSIGCGPVLRLASEQPPGAVLLLSPFTSILEMAHLEVGLPTPLLRLALPDRWNNEMRIAEVECPTIIMHGDRDKVVPFQHSLDLFEECAAHAKYIAMLKGVGHADIPWVELIQLHMGPFLQRSMDGSDVWLELHPLCLPKGCFEALASLDRDCIPSQITTRAIRHCKANIIEVPAPSTYTGHG